MLCKKCDLCASNETMIYLKRSFILLLSLFIISCGGDSSKKSNQPKDLNFSTVSSPEEFSDLVLKSVSSYRGIVLGSQMSNKDIDQEHLKRTVNMYAEAMGGKKWIREDAEIKQDGNLFIKSYRWLDERRRMAMNVIVTTRKRGNELSLEGVEFKTNLDILENVKF